MAKPAFLHYKTHVYTIGQAEVITVSDYYNGEYLDTLVKVNGRPLCTVAGCDLGEFITELKTFIEKYRI